MTEEERHSEQPRKVEQDKSNRDFSSELKSEKNRARREREQRAYVGGKGTYEALRRREIVQNLRNVFDFATDEQRKEIQPTLELLLDNPRTYPQAGEFATQISELESEIREKTHALLEQELSAKDKQRSIEDLQTNLKVLSEKQSLSHLLSRVGSAAQEMLLTSLSFRALFEQESPHLSFVLSIDIRRSTELMLKARNPRLYAGFITGLAKQLREVILNNYGIFDKFTGDGILAFFPEFYTGDDAGYFVLRAAHDCHRIFTDHYRTNKHCFTSILQDIGLGIGVDYGEVQIVQIGGDFSVVGTPVVYACRMGGADAGHTYINQPAYEELFEAYSAICDFDEHEITIKREGKTLAYGVQLNGKQYDPKAPHWTKTDEADEISAAKVHQIRKA
jgi:class 3 adenylate cyclase